MPARNLRSQPGVCSKKTDSPKKPEDLAQHSCLSFGSGSNPGSWVMERGSEQLTFSFEPRLVVNDFEILQQAVANGLGVAMLPIDRSSKMLRSGALEQVVPEWKSPEIPISAVYPSVRHLSPKVRAFLDHLQDDLSGLPWREPAATT